MQVEPTAYSEPEGAATADAAAVDAERKAAWWAGAQRKHDEFQATARSGVHDVYLEPPGEMDMEGVDDTDVEGSPVEGSELAPSPPSPASWERTSTVKSPPTGAAVATSLLPRFAAAAGQPSPEVRCVCPVERELYPTSAPAPN